MNISDPEKVSESVAIDVEGEKSYVRKVDVFILPLLCLMYFFDCMDRSNLANAKTDGLDEDLHLQGNDYSLMVLLFYIPFGLCDLPWNLLIKRYSGRIMLSFIPNVIWFEDALRHYGVHSCIRLHLLVPDIDKAAGFLINARSVIDSGPHRIGNAEDQDWKSPLTNDYSSEDAVLVAVSPHQKVSFLPLPGLLDAPIEDAPIESWLDCASDDAMLLLHLACQISYLYAHAPSLKQGSFGEKMKPEHQQFHYDVLAGMDTGTVPFRQRQRAIRDALLQGQYGPCQSSASRDNKDLFSLQNDVPR
ncbi:hypothetical protein MW887_003348 [Aspergillus wentii]|nr:hypothetical protein MW887_003348 [Aspergillus wentii]